MSVCNVYCDDCKVILPSLKGIADMIYLDPPYNKKREFNIIEGDERMSFSDMWEWNSNNDCIFDLEDVPVLIREFCKRKDSCAQYRYYMWERLRLCYEALKPTGTLYLHIDPNTESAYLKVMLDEIFGGPDYCINTVVWKRSDGNKAKKYGPIHDDILVYAKSKIYTWVEPEKRWLNEPRRSHDLIGPGITNGESGRSWRGMNPNEMGKSHWAVPKRDKFPPWIEFPEDYNDLGPHSKLDVLLRLDLIEMPRRIGVRSIPKFKVYYDNDGIACHDWIDNIAKVHGAIWPTEKPVELIRWFIQHSTHKGEVVLDPFMGGGTTLEAALSLGRSAIGIDASVSSIRVTKERLNISLNIEPHIENISSALVTDEGKWPPYTELSKLMTDNGYQAQQLICDLLNVRCGPAGADGGIDGTDIVAVLNEMGHRRTLTVRYQIGAKKSVNKIRELKGVLKDDEIGVVISDYDFSKSAEAEVRDYGNVIVNGVLLSKIQLISLRSLVIEGNNPAYFVLRGKETQKNSLFADDDSDKYAARIERHQKLIKRLKQDPNYHLDNLDNLDNLWVAI